MTKHGAVVVPEDAVVAAAAAVGRHFSFPPPRTAGGDSCKKLAAQQIDLGAAVVGSWLDSMKASSPRHRLMAPAVADTEHDDWMEKHPSALGKFEALAAAAKGKRIVVFLDYDGTLSPIVEDPDRAVMTDEMREAVRGVAERFPTAIVSGRCRDKVLSFVRLEELYYAGSHGMDIQGPTAASKGEESVLCQPAREFLPMIGEAYAALVEKVEGVIPGAKVENNKFCLSVHFRRVDERRWGAVADQVRAVLRDYPRLRLTQGRKVLEVRPTIKGHGAGILVSRFPKDTCASFSLRDPGEVKDFLCKLGEESVLCQPAREFLPMIGEAYAALVEKVEGVIPGAKVENNKFCLSVHFRRVDERRWGAVADQVRAVLRDYPRLRLTQGRKVLEVRPTIKWDKGEALRFLLSALGFSSSSSAAGDGEDDGDDDAFPIYIGDDRTDEDAFRVLRSRGHGAGILVSRFPKDTCASFSLRDPGEVKDFLCKLVTCAAA
uniref:Trehalose 6-phosphate phosphatase n=1 Tax=Oryza punctata TaxID=4537 RepID=A0A0E0KEG2_ORYPU